MRWIDTWTAELGDVVGKWATYQRRGGGGKQSGPPFPPTPTLLATDNGDNTFGLQILTPASGAGIATVQIFQNGADQGSVVWWAGTMLFNGTSGVDTWTIALNGDGSTYAGQSPQSNVSP